MRILKRVCGFTSLFCLSLSAWCAQTSLAQAPERPASKGAENVAMSAEQRAAFRAARTVKVVSQVSAANPENVLQPPKLTVGEKTWVQPFEEATAAVLEKMGMAILKGESGTADIVITAHATVETRANSFGVGRQGNQIVAVQYQGIGARWKGSATVAAANAPPFTLRFEGDTVTPNADKTITLMIANPEAARLDFTVTASHAATMALFGPGSYAAAIQDLLGQTHGTAHLFEVLRDTQKAAWWRGTAASTLGLLGGKEAADVLLAALKDPAAEVRAGAADGLGRLGDHSAIEPLVKSLKDSSPAVRARAAVGLGLLADSRATEPLIETTLNDGIDEVSMRATSALARISASSVTKLLTDALQDKDAGKRRRAVRALGKLSDTQTLEPLAIAARDENVAVREEAIKALAQLNDPRSSEIIMKASRDASADVRAAAVSALETRRDPRAVELLLATLTDSDATVQRKAIRALGEIGDRRAAPPLLPLLEEKNASLRLAAAESLRLVCDQTCVGPLIAALKDKDASVRAAVARALEQVTSQRLGEDRKQWEKWWKQNQKTP